MAGLGRAFALPSAAFTAGFFEELQHARPELAPGLQVEVTHVVTNIHSSPLSFSLKLISLLLPLGDLINGWSL